MEINYSQKNNTIRLHRVKKIWSYKKKVVTLQPKSYDKDTSVAGKGFALNADGH